MDGRENLGVTTCNEKCQTAVGNVMTFMVNQDGVVYQKDLGKKTEAIGKSIHEYNPDSSWGKAEEEPEQTGTR